MTYSAVIEELEKDLFKKDIPDFAIGDTISVHLKINEGNKERVQVFTGTVIAVKGHGVNTTVSLHRNAYGEGMERVFILHSPLIQKIEVVRKGKVRRNKLYYLRGTSGKKARVKALVYKKPTKEAKAAKKSSVEEVKQEAPQVEEAAPQAEEASTDES